jgi:hypothetical protein
MCPHCFNAGPPLEAVGLFFPAAAAVRYLQHDPRLVRTVTDLGFRCRGLNTFFHF